MKSNTSAVNKVNASIGKFEVLDLTLLSPSEWSEISQAISILLVFIIISAS